jgi:hypothetical protein
VSKFDEMHASYCRTKAARAAAAAADPEKAAKRAAYNEQRAILRQFGVNCPPRAVLVIDQMVADPYFISMNEYQVFKNEYLNTPGIRAIVLVKEAAK